MLGNVKTQTRLAVGFGAILSLLFLLAGFSVARTYAVAENTDRVLRDKLHDERLMNEWKELIEKNAIRTIAAGKAKDKATQNQFLEEMQTDSDRTTAVVAELTAKVTDPRARELMQKAEVVRSAYRHDREQGFAMKDKGDLAGARAFFGHQFSDRAKQYVDAVSAVLSRQRALIDNAAADIHASNGQTIAIAAGISVIALLLSGALAYLIGRSITRQQAAAAEEAASSIEKLATTVQQNAEHARLGDELPKVRKLVLVA